MPFDLERSRFVKLGALAKQFNMDPTTIRMIVRKGELPEPERMNGSWVFRREDVQRWAKQSNRTLLTSFREAGTMQRKRKVKVRGRDRGYSN